MAKKKVEKQEINVHKVDIQNEPPVMWDSFESFWKASVKNGTPFLMEACKEHLKALDLLDKPNRWVEGALHFGIRLEK